jgi:hypothetical protein
MKRYLVLAGVVVLCAVLSMGGSLRSQGDSAPATRFYVDPDWAGEETGAPETPWVRLTEAAWDRINGTLAHNDVTIHFSAREADADTNETTTSPLSILRTDQSEHRLTLDGMSQYNTDDGRPSWSEYTGDSRFHIAADYPIGSNKGTKRSYVTVRGFDVVAGTGGRGGQGIHYWGGDHVVIEHCRITKHPDVAHGPGIIFGYAWQADGTPENGGCTDLVIRNNVVHNTYGEGIYIGGSHDVDRPAHRNVTIEGNTVYDVAVYGGEGDAIDIKDGSSNVVIRGNTLYMTEPGASRDGIAMSGGGIIEGNFIYHFGRAGITLGTYWNAHACRDGTVIRNNIIVHTGGNPQYSWDYGIIVAGSDDGDQYTNMGIYNNTICGVQTDREGGGSGLSIQRQAVGARVLNNIVYSSAGLDFDAEDGCLAEHDHNLYYTPGDGAVVARYGRARLTAAQLQEFEPNSLAEDPLFVSPQPPYSPDGFRLQAASPVIGAGVPIDLFTTDFFGVERGPVWDMGAVQTRR